MQKLLLVTLIVFLASMAGAVERAGYVVALPHGWRNSVGTCTGVLTCMYPSSEAPTILISVGSRTYRDPYADDGKFISDPHFYRFDDILSSFSSSCGAATDQISAFRIKTSRSKNVLIGWIKAHGTEPYEKPYVRFAAIESEDSLQVLTIFCGFDLSAETLANEVFEKAVISVIGDCESLHRYPTGPNQALVPTPASVTPAADAPVAPDTGAAHL